MVVFPLKFLPWLLIVAGIGFMCTGEAIAWGIVLLVIGLVWAGFQVAGWANKRKAKQAAPVPRTAPDIRLTPNENTQPPQRAYAPSQAEYAPQPASRCPRCQNEDIEDAVFCGKCGYKLQ
jgi:hypothetical protein